MTKRAASLGVACLMLLGGCDDRAREQNNVAAVAPAAPAEEYQAKLSALSEGQRNAVFIRAIRDAGRECQRVDTSAPLAPINGAPAWRAVCDGGAEWIIVIGKDGIVLVTNDAELRAADVTTNTSQ